MAMPSVRRRESILYYIKHPQDPNNISAASPDTSFAQFVCTGTGSFARRTASIEYLTKYASTVDQLATPAAGGFSDQWKAFIGGMKPIFKLDGVKDDGQAEDLFKVCVLDVKRRLAFNGASASDTRSESFGAIIGAITAGRVLINSLGAFGAGLLKPINEAQSRARLKTFVRENDDEVLKVLGGDLAPDKMNVFWERRRSLALWKPYLTFKHMVAVNPATSETHIMGLASDLDIQLSEWDTMSVATPPGNVVKAVAQSQTTLKAALDNKTVTIGDLYTFVVGVEDWLDQTKRDYDGVVKARADANTAIDNAEK